jgi:sulfonate transport system substrate-binding protein
MSIRFADRWQWLRAAAAMLLLAAGGGCARVVDRRPAAADNRVNPARLYASYQFETAPTALNFGVQPLWIPTCVIWEVMARDQQLQDDLRRAHCRLYVYPFFKGRDLNEFLRAGNLQGGISGDLPSLNAATELDMRIVSLAQQGPCSVVAREGVSLEALRGRRIGYAPGSNAHYTLLRLLREQHLGPREVRLIPMEVIGMADALAAGRIDAFSAWEPTPTLALLDHPDFNVIARADARGYLGFTRRFFEQRPAAVRAMVAAEIRAVHWLRINDKNLYIASGWARQRAVAFAGGEMPLTVYDFLRLAHGDLLRVPTAPRLLPGSLAPSSELWRQFQLSRAFGLISPDADWRRVRESFITDLVPRIISDSLRAHPAELSPGPALPMRGTG